MPFIYLSTEYAQRSAVKALGARWDAQARKWYAPDGRDLAPFNAWMPADMRSTQIALVDAESAGAVKVARRGRFLSELLGAVTEVVARTFRQGEWTVVDVVQVTVKKHVFLEVSERDANGVVLAKASAMMWANVADEVLPAFEAATGMSIGPGMKLLARARPEFSPQHGFRIFIDAVDPDFTLGEPEARKREIRARLKQQGRWANNKAFAQTLRNQQDPNIDHLLGKAGTLLILTRWTTTLRSRSALQFPNASAVGQVLPRCRRDRRPS